MPRLSVPLTDDQHAAIRRKAGALGVPQAEVARRLLLAWVRGEMEMPVLPDEKPTPTKARCGFCNFDFNTYGSTESQFVYAMGDRLACPICARPMEWVE